MTSSFGTKSCINCPSFSKGSDVVSHVNKNINSDMCSRFGKILSVPKSSPEHQNRLRESLAKDCSVYGQPQVRAGIAELKLEVAMPNFEAISAAEHRDPRYIDMAKSCGLCKHYMPDRVVAKRYGWWAGMCTAKGKLILGNRQTFEARGCEYKEYGESVGDDFEINLLPEYEDNFWLNTTSLKEMLAKANSITDPGDWPTDKPVSPSEEKTGIKAWRKIIDPAGTSNFTYLPIYDRGFFSIGERDKIPQTGDDEHPESYLDHAGAVYKVSIAWMELDETPILWGVAGTGKTELYRHLAWMMQLPFERISITGSTELDDLAGKMMFIDNETKFQYGRVPLAWGKPSVICLDEPNVGPPDVWQFIRPLTDNSKQLVLDQNAGERIARDQSCFLGMAANPSWDVINVGAQTIGDADGSRLLHIFMDLPPANIERQIIKTRIEFDGWKITEGQLDTLMAIASDLRALCEQGNLPISWGVRPQIKVARACRWFDLIQAYRMAAADYLDPAAQEEMLNVVRAHLDSSGRR